MCGCVAHDEHEERKNESQVGVNRSIHLRRGSAGAAYFRIIPRNHMVVMMLEKDVERKMRPYLF